MKGERSILTQQRTLKQFECLERNSKVFQQESTSKLNSFYNMGNKDKNKNQGDSATEGVLGDSITSPRDACHTNRDLSWEREAQDATLAKQVVEAIAREMTKAHTHYQALLNKRNAAVIPTSLKVTSRTSCFKVMDPFDLTKDKAIYQRWQM